MDTDNDQSTPAVAPSDPAANGNREIELILIIAVLSIFFKADKIVFILSL